MIDKALKITLLLVGLAALSLYGHMEFLMFIPLFIIMSAALTIDIVGLIPAVKERDYKSAAILVCFIFVAVASLAAQFVAVQKH
jgi:hypothetical protein